MSERKGSIRKSSRRGSSFVDYGSLPRPGSFSGGLYDPDETLNIPNSVIERRASIHGQYGGEKKGKRQSMPNLVGYSEKDSVYLLMPKDKLNARKWLVGPCCFLYMAVYFSFQSIFTQYVYKRLQSEFYPDIDTFNKTSVCFTNKSDPDYVKQTRVQTEASKWNMYFNLAAGIPAIFTSILFGASSDKYGRKLFFFLPMIGAFLKIAICVAGYHYKFDLVYFLIGFAIDGVSGYVTTMLLISFTYVADITPPRGRQRTLGITLVELSNGIGITLGNFSMGYFIQDIGFFYPMVTCGVAILLAIAILIFLPESFPPDKRNPIDSVCDKVKTVFEMLFGATNKGRRWMYFILLFIFNLTAFATFVRTSVETLYLLDSPFCWTPEKLGYYSSAKSLLQNIIGMGLLKLMQTKMSDESIAMLGCVSFAGNFVIEGIAQNDLFMYIGMYS